MSVCLSVAPDSARDFLATKLERPDLTGATEEELMAALDDFASGGGAEEALGATPKQAVGPATHPFVHSPAQLPVLSSGRPSGFLGHAVPLSAQRQLAHLMCS
jgi:hypothetical protein